MPVNLALHPHLNHAKCFSLTQRPQSAQVPVAESGVFQRVLSWFMTSEKKEKTENPDDWIKQLSQQLADATFPELKIAQANLTISSLCTYYKTHLVRHLGYAKDKRSLNGLEPGLKLIHQTWPTLSNPNIAAVKLVEDIDKCTDGHFDRVNVVLLDIQRKLPDSMPKFLEKIREHIVGKLASSSTLEVHTHNRFFTIAHREGYGVHPLNEADRYIGNGEYTDERIKTKLQNTFQQEYAPGSIISKLYDEFYSALITLGYTGRKSEGLFYNGEQSSLFMNFFNTIFPGRSAHDFFIIDDNDCVIDIDWISIKKTMLLLLLTEGYFNLPNHMISCFLALTREESRPEAESEPINYPFLMQNGFITNRQSSNDFAQFILPLCTHQEQVNLLNSMEHLGTTSLLPLIKLCFPDVQISFLEHVMSSGFYSDLSFNNFLDRIRPLVDLDILIHVTLFYVTKIRTQYGSSRPSYYPIRLLSSLSSDQGSTSLFELVWVLCTQKRNLDRTGSMPMEHLTDSEAFFVLSRPQQRALVLDAISKRRLDRLTIDKFELLQFSCEAIFDIMQALPHENQKEMFAKSSKDACHTMIIKLPKDKYQKMLPLWLEASLDTLRTSNHAFGLSPLQQYAHRNGSSLFNINQELGQSVANLEIDFWLKGLEEHQHVFSDPAKIAECKQLHAVLNQSLSDYRNGKVDRQTWTDAWYNTITQSSLQKKEQLARILKNLLICLTIIGAVVVLGKVIYDKHHDRAQYGFFPSKTRELLYEVEKLPSLVSAQAS